MKQNNDKRRTRKRNSQARPVSVSSPLPKEEDPLKHNVNVIVTKSPKKIDLRPSKLVSEAERQGGFGRRPYNLTEREKRKVKEMSEIGKTMKRKQQKLRNMNKLRVSRDPYIVKDPKAFYGGNFTSSIRSFASIITISSKIPVPDCTTPTRRESATKACNSIDSCQNER